MKLYNKIKGLLRPYTGTIDAITSFLFIALVFYLTYIALWVFCPCG